MTNRLPTAAALLCALAILAGCNSTFPTEQEWAAMTPEQREYFLLKRQDDRQRGAAIRQAGRNLAARQPVTVRVIQ